jgi:hypothetical protein
MMQQSRHFGPGRQSQLPVQHAHALLVLAQSRRLLSCPGIDLHQVAVSRFVEGIKGYPAPGIGNGGRVLVAGCVGTDQSAESRGQLLAQALRFERLPIVKVGAIAQGKA